MSAPTLAMQYEVDLTDLDFFGKLATFTGEGLETIIRKRAPALARALAQYTMPVADAWSGGGIDDNTYEFTGDSMLARDLGRAAVRRDIRRVYMTPAEAYEAVLAKKGILRAKGFYKLMKHGLFQAASLDFKACTGRILDVIPFDGGNLHQQFRGARGRVTRRHPVVIITDPRPLAEYIRQVEKRVGWAKSGWFQAGQAVPGGQGGRVPAWMQLPAPGNATLTSSNDVFEVHLNNAVPYVSTILDDRNYYRAIDLFYGKIEREADAVMNYVLNKLLHS